MSEHLGCTNRHHTEIVQIQNIRDYVGTNNSQLVVTTTYVIYCKYFLEIKWKESNYVISGIKKFRTKNVLNLDLFKTLPKIK